MAPYQAKFVPVKLNQEVKSTLLVTPQPRFSKINIPYLVQVDQEGQIRIPLFNDSRAEKVFGKGTILGTSEAVSVPQNQVQVTREIHNDLIPQNDEPKEKGTRSHRLKDLIRAQDWQHLSTEEKAKLKELILQHDALFILGKDELGLIQGPPAHIKVQDPNPSRAPTYRYPEQAKQLIADMLQDMEEREIIEPSTAAWLSPIVLVNKPDGSKRMCLDYRLVNKHLATDIYPLPRLQELVEQAAGHRYYATLDMREAYFQIPLDKDSRDLTTFSDGVKLYRFKRLPFGLNCSPAIFSRRMASILEPLVQQGWIKNYLDDLILWAPTFQVLVDRLGKLFSLFEDVGAKLNMSKCKFGLPEVTFLGHKISVEGSSPDPKNVVAVADMKPPRSVKEVRRFLGMCGFYRKFVPDFAKIAAPLTSLTRAGITFEWTEDAQRAFENLKASLVSPPILVKAQTDQPFILTTDASDTHVGAVLSQIQIDDSIKPVGFFSKKLNSCEVRYSATDKEALAVVLACRHYHHYLWGVKFTIVTDHQPLTSVFKRKTKCPRMSRWILEMREYNYNVQYLKGKYNVVADQLSRPVRVVTRAPTTGWLGLSTEQFRAQQEAEQTWAEVISFLKGGKVPTKQIAKATLDQFALQEDVLYYVREKSDGSLQFNVVVPRTLVPQAIKLAHEKAGHLGQKKTIATAEEHFFFPNLKVQCTDYVKQCITCQRFKGTTGLQMKWQELPPVSGPLERIGIDLIDLHAGAEGYRYVLTMVDHYSRFAQLFPLKTRQTGPIVAHLNTFCATYGTPQAIVLDNAAEFTSGAFRDFAAKNGIELHYITPYHPQGNSVTERLHRTLKGVLAALCDGHPMRWPHLLQAVQVILNEAVHLSIGQQPYFAFFGRHPRRRVTKDLPTISGDEDGLKVAKQLIRETSQKMCRRYREQANRGRKNQKVEVGTLVMIRRETVLPGTATKLNPRWEGPYRVSEVLNEGVAYIVVNMFTGQTTQRAAAQVKVYHGPCDLVLGELDPSYLPEPEVVIPPPRQRQPPRRYIEECHVREAPFRGM